MVATASLFLPSAPPKRAGLATFPWFFYEARNLAASEGLRQHGRRAKGPRAFSGKRRHVWLELQPGLLGTTLTWSSPRLLYVQINKGLRADLFEFSIKVRASNG